MLKKNKTTKPQSTKEAVDQLVFSAKFLISYAVQEAKLKIEEVKKNVSNKRKK